MTTPTDCFIFLPGRVETTNHICLYIYIHTYAVDVLETIGVSDLGIHFIKRSVKHRGFSTATKAGATASALPGCARLRGAGI